MNQIHPRYQHTLDDLFLQVFVLIDDFLQPFEPQLPSQAHQKASISEILTIAIVGEILAQPFESVWYWLVTQNHQDLQGALSLVISRPPDPSGRRHPHHRERQYRKYRTPEFNCSNCAFTSSSVPSDSAAVVG